MKKIEVPRDFYMKVQQYREYNEKIIKYYFRLNKEQPLRDFTAKIQNISLCNKYHELDRYEKAKVKDLKKTNLCKDPFCSNCKVVKQGARMGKYIPELKAYSGLLYEMVLTQPNCGSDGLRPTLGKMSHSFMRLIRLLDGRHKIVGLDFSDWGYEGAVRNLEVTYKWDRCMSDDSYHPHYHAIFIFNMELGEKHIQNKYSRNSKSDKVRLFSDKEILLQKIWYLLINDIPVTKKAVDELEIGYSCMIDDFEEDRYVEIFKYMVKATDERDSLMSYSQFKTLRDALHGVKQIQGYGALYRVNGEISEGDIEKANQVYDEIMETLQKEESPIHQVETIDDLLGEQDYLLISRKKIRKYVIQAMQDA